jgi:TPR repeat protein
MVPALLAALIQRGDAMFALQDVSAARLLYARAAAGGSGTAATAAGKTYDPAFVAEDHTQADPTAAADWYRRAIALGDHEAEGLLEKLVPSMGN